MNRLVRLNKLLLADNSRKYLYLSFNGQQKAFNSTIPPGPSVNPVSISPTGYDDSVQSKIYSLITDSPITHGIEDTLKWVHDIDLPVEWWMCVSLSAITFRLFVGFPIQVFNRRLKAKLENLQPHIKAQTLDQIKGWKPQHIDKKLMTEVTKEKIRVQESIYEKEDVSPVKGGVASFIQLPFWLYISAAIRNLATGQNNNIISHFEMQKEGLLWFQNLAMPDPYFLIPVIYGTVSLVNLQYQMLVPKELKQKGATAIVARYFVMIPLIGLMTYMTTKMSTAVSLFWIISTTSNLVEGIILESPKVKKLLKIPKTPYDTDRPYKRKYDLLKDEWKGGINSLKNFFKDMKLLFKILKK